MQIRLINYGPTETFSLRITALPTQNQLVGPVGMLTADIEIFCHRFRLLIIGKVK
jgi:hypothetical protein